MIRKLYFAERAYVSLQIELKEANDLETGGVLLGHIIDDVCYIIESIPPGLNSIHSWNFFEYDQQFVEYLANFKAKLYEKEPILVGIWHSHPGGDSTFSSEDMELNKKISDISNTDIVSLICMKDETDNVVMRLFGIRNGQDEQNPYSAYPITYCKEQNDVLVQLTHLKVFR